MAAAGAQPKVRTVTPERWQRINELFRSTLEREPGGRSAFLAEACAGDDPLRLEVETLIASHDQSGSFMEAPAFEAAAELLAGDQVEPLVGQRIGPYQIIAPLGEGGMGEVYLAEDARLGRHIALKLLPPYFGADEDRLRRFAQEARAASALNHPNVCVIYEVGETDEGRHYIAMEYVDGETLRQVMTAGRMGLGEVLDVAVQVASGLAAAHQLGTVHRDIKPENVMLRRDGYVKVLDFGLAKLTDPPTAERTTPAGARLKTDTGIVMGTGRYMSPEQTRGLAVDARSDIWSLGVVLFEMATGHTPFEGATTSDLIVSILEREPPPLAQLSPGTPPELQRIITEALQKERGKRYQTAWDLLTDLKRLKQELGLEAQPARRGQPGSPGRSSFGVSVTTQAAGLGPRWLANRWILLGIVMVSVVGTAIWYNSSRLASERTALPKSEPRLPPANVVPFTSFPGRENWPVFSPDGDQVAFTWDGPAGDNFDLYVKLVGAGEPLRLTSHPGVDSSPAWSPDGKHIAFTRFHQGQSAIYTVPALGGPERKLLQLGLGSAWFGYPMVVWSADGRWLAFTDKSSPQGGPAVFLLSVETLEKRRLTSPSAQHLGDWWPAFSPDGKTLAFIRQMSEGVSDIYLASVDGGEPRRLTLNGAGVLGLSWTPDGGSLVFKSTLRGGRLRLWRMPTSGGTPEPLAVGADVIWSVTGNSPPSISRYGHRLAYVQSMDDTNIWRIGVPGSAGRANSPIKLISSTQYECGPQFSPDGKRIVFQSTRSGSGELWACDSDGTNAIQLTSVAPHGAGTARGSPDGRHIAFDSRPEGHADIFVTSAEGGSPRRLTTDPANDVVPSWSRDGRWIYFSSNRGGTRQVWKMPAEGGRATQVTKQGGFAAFESTDGSVLYYAKFDSPGLWRVPVGGGEESLVLDQLRPGYWGAWAVADEGIYFIDPEERPRAALEFFSFATRRVTRIALLEKEPAKFTPNLALSPDGRSILYTQLDQSGNDIMLVENFH